MRHIVYKMLGITGINRLFTQINRRKPIVLTFHGITSENTSSIYNYQGKHLHLKIFSELMEYLHAWHNPVSVTQIMEWLEGRSELPERAVALTFDDGYRNVLVNAVPILAQLDIPATIYIATDFVNERKMIWTDCIISALGITKRTFLTLKWNGQKIRLPIQNNQQKKIADGKIRYLCKGLPYDERAKIIQQVMEELSVNDKQVAAAWRDHDPLHPDDLKMLLDQGVEIGSHTKSHKIVSRCTPDEMREELEDSKKFIEGITGKACEQFAYPNGKMGDFNEQTKILVKEIGYKCAVTTISKRLSRSHDPFEIPRYTLMHNRMNITEFAAEMSGFPSYLRAIKRKVTFGR